MHTELADPLRTVRMSLPVSYTHLDRIPITLQINLISLFAALPVGMAAGIIAAIKKNTIIDHLVSLMVVLFISIPSFVFAAGLQYFLGFKTGVFPIIYNVSAKGLLRWQSMFMPILALAFDPIARVARYLRAELAAVSYTHLDVYKRQVLSSFGK